MDLRLGYAAAGIGVGWAGASAGISMMWSTVSNVYQIRGWSACGSIGFTWIVGAAISACGWDRKGKRYFTFGVTVNAGLRGPSVTATASATGEASRWVRTLLGHEYAQLKWAVNNNPIK